MNAEQFITEKYKNNNWGLYPPSRRLVTEWLQEYADQQLILHGVVSSASKCYSCDNCGRIRNDKPCIVCGSD